MAQEYVIFDKFTEDYDIFIVMEMYPSQTNARLYTREFHDSSNKQIYMKSLLEIVT